MNDKAHARAALSRAAHKGGSVASAVKAKVHAKFPDIGSAQSGHAQRRAHYKSMRGAQ